MTLTYQRFTAVLLLIYGSLFAVLLLIYGSLFAVLLLIYGSLFLSGIYYCLCVFWCATARMSELELEQRTKIKFLVVS